MRNAYYKLIMTKLGQPQNVVAVLLNCAMRSVCACLERVHFHLKNVDQLHQSKMVYERNWICLDHKKEATTYFTKHHHDEHFCFSTTCTNSIQDYKKSVNLKTFTPLGISKFPYACPS